ncbi:MAG: hypothetical protein QF473_08645 [Planctomycetota bacterium]|jgi:hypothetical protein|nr:hypothetical protein [Planctomycetota bacterium]
MGIAWFYRRHDKGKSDALYLKVLDDAAIKDRDRWSAFRILTKKGPYSRHMELIEKYLDGFAKTEPKRVEQHMLKYFGGVHMRPDYFGWDSRYNPAFIIWAGKRVLAYDTLSIKDRANVSKHMINAYLDFNQRAEALATAKAIAARKGCQGIVAEQYRLLATVIERKARPGQVRRAASALIKLCRKEEMKGLEQAEVLGTVAQVAVRACNDSAAVEIDEVRSALIKPEPRRKLNCEFVDEAPNDISAWLNSPAIKEKGRYGVMDRKYGNNLKNLIATDAAITSRVTGASASDERARFSVLADAEGLHFFLLAPCKNHEDVADGLEATQSYEMYFAPGKNEPYYCYITNPGQKRFDHGDFYHTMYRNRHHRQTRMDEKTLFTDSRATPQGTATYFRIPWEVLYDKLPERGETYEYECIHWANGGMSWGGSKSVHNRSSFGDIVFSNLTAKNLTAIKRRIIKKAYSHYRLEKSGKYNGVVDFWKDPELGDPEFYNSCLRDMVKKLDDYGKMIKAGMSDAEVETLFAEAVPKWMEIEYEIADLRSRYMSDKLFADGE